MRSLSGTLLAAQKAATGIPFVRTVVKNSIRDLKHLVFAQLYTSADADTPHGAAAGATYLHRIRNSATSGVGNAQYQRDSGGWTTMSSAADAVHVAIAASGARVILLYNRGLNLYVRESTDDGGTFTAETFVTASTGAVGGVAIAYDGGSFPDFCLFWIDAALVKKVRRIGGGLGAVTTWTPMTAATLNGIAVAWNGDYLLMLTGTATTTLRPTLWSLILGDGFSFSSDTWTAFFIQQQAEADELITYNSPSLALIETMRMTFVEKFTGTTAYTRTYWSAIALTANYSPGNWEWLEASPLDNTTNYGYAVAKGMTPDVAIYSRPGRVLTAPTAAVTLDMSADLIEATIDERDGLTQRGEFIFDNSAGTYAGPPSTIQLHRTLDIGIGYDAEYSRPPAQTIVGWEWRRTGGRSLFVLFTRGADYWLDMTRTRTTIVETRTLSAIARAAAARTGFDYLASGASTRATAFNIAWVVNPFQSQLDVLRALAAIMPDVFLTFSTGTLLIHEPLAADSADYTYGTDHAIYESKWNDEPHASVAEVLNPTPLLGQAFDHTEMNFDKPIQVRTRSPHESAAADATANATARLRKTVLQEERGELVTPPNVGLEVADVVTLTDTAISGSAVTGRVSAIKTIMRRRDGKPVLYQQTITLSAV